MASPKSRYPKVVELSYGVQFPELSLTIEGDKEFFKKLIDALLAFDPPEVEYVDHGDNKEVTEIVLHDVMLTLKRKDDNKYALIIE